MLACIGLSDIEVSPVYRTRAQGAVRQPPFFNMVAVGQYNETARQLLRSLKSLERRAGRRVGVRNGPRPLDLDVLDYRGRALNWQHYGGRSKGKGRAPLVLPHPEISRRAFVLVPLLDVWPDWRHPVSGESLSRLLAKLGGLNAIVLRREMFPIDSASILCD